MKTAFASLAPALLLLSACSGGIIPNSGPTSVSDPAPTQHSDKAAVPIPSKAVAPLPAATPSGDGNNAASLGVVRGPQIGALPVAKADADAAMAAFRTSCPGLVRREDLSGLTQGQDWQPACDAVKNWTGDGLSFFATYLDAVQVGDGKAFATGYYEPEIAASRTKQPGYETPIYRRPLDLVEVDLGNFGSDLKGRRIRGEVKNGNLVMYADRTAIEEGRLANRGLEIAWAKDPVEFFFLQIQGSGMLRLTDGSIIRIGYDSQNGHPYTGIGKLMKDRSLITDGSMQGLYRYLRANPDEGRKIMRENKSFVFFREAPTGPNGAMGYTVIAESSVAADPKFIPLGAPVWLSMDRAEPNGLWVAQDTGGAIRGANRVDTFWGAGARAVGIAGGMSARGSALLFLPKASVVRLIPTP